MTRLATTCLAVLALGGALTPTAAWARSPSVVVNTLRGNLDPAVLEVFSERLAQALSRETGLTVATTQQVSEVLGLERQKQLLGCNETSCTSELLGALGSDVLVMGTVARSGAELLVTVKAVGAKSARALAVHSGVANGEKEALIFLDECAAVLAKPVREALPAPASATSAASHAWIPAVVGGVAVLGGGAAFGLAWRQEQLVRAGDPSLPTYASAQQAAQLGRTENTVAVGALAVGVAALAVAGGLALFGGGDGPAVTLVPIAEGGVAVVGGHF